MYFIYIFLKKIENEVSSERIFQSTLDALTTNDSVYKMAVAGENQIRIYNLAVNNNINYNNNILVLNINLHFIINIRHGKKLKMKELIYLKMLEKYKNYLGLEMVNYLLLQLLMDVFSDF